MYYSFYRFMLTAVCCVLLKYSNMANFKTASLPKRAMANLWRGSIILQRILFLYLLINILQLQGSYSFEQELTITIPPGGEECFYHATQQGHIVDIEYQVIDGGHGNLDINFGLYSPEGKLLAVDVRKTESAHRQEAKESGDYKMCFDNTFSRISSKVVFFELIVEPEGSDDYDDDEDLKASTINGVEGDYDVTVEDIQGIIDEVKTRLTRARHIQEQLRAFEARDRNIQERNFNAVNNWSMLQIIIMLIVGGIQVIMVRSLFDDKSRIHKLMTR